MDDDKNLIRPGSQPTAVEPTAPIEPLPATAPVDSTPPVDQILPEQPKKSRLRMSKRVKIILLAVLVAIILIGGSAAAYLGVIVPNQPENVLKQALAQTLDQDTTKSFGFDGTIAITPEGMEDPFNLSFSGANDTSGTGPFWAKLSADIGISVIKLDTLSTNGKDLFFKIDGLEGVESLAGLDDAYKVYIPIIKSLNGYWVELGENFTKNFRGDTSDPNKVKEDQQKLVEAYERNSFITVASTLPDEDINGQDSKHYLLGIDKTKFKAFMADLKNSGISGFDLNDEQLSRLNTEIDKADLSKVSFEVWINKSTKYFSAVQVKFTDKTVVALKVNLKDYNKPVEVSPPENAKSLLEVMSQSKPLLEMFTGGQTNANSLIESL